VRSGVGRNLLMGGQAGSLEDGIPQRDPAESLGGGLEAKSPETKDKCACISKISNTISLHHIYTEVFLHNFGLLLPDN